MCIDGVWYTSLCFFLSFRTVTIATAATCWYGLTWRVRVTRCYGAGGRCVFSSVSCSWVLGCLQSWLLQELWGREINNCEIIVLCLCHAFSAGTLCACHNWSLASRFSFFGVFLFFFLVGCTRHGSKSDPHGMTLPEPKPFKIKTNA